MASRNVAQSRSVPQATTFEGGAAIKLTPEQNLRRAVMACLLWENSFYESGEDIVTRIKKLVKEVVPDSVMKMAVEAREQMKLRHVPLLLCRELARAGTLKAETLTRVIQRPDEITEFLALYWDEGKTPISYQCKKGLANAFNKFNEYSFAKYNQTGEGKITLRDAMFLTHPKPNSPEQATLFTKIVNNTLATPDTWEVALSSGANKKETFERLIQEEKLGGLALLRNLRNMGEANVSVDIIRNAIHEMDTSRILPFRFIAAANYAKHLEPELEEAMFRSIQTLSKLDGKTVVLVDVSGSMVGTKVSEKSDMDRLDAASALAMIIREMSDCQVFTFSDDITELYNIKGFKLRDRCRSSAHNGTRLGNAVNVMNAHVEYDRIIVITDEQSQDAVPGPKAKGYMINVASHQNSVGYGPWTKITGWSEAIVSYIVNHELELSNG